MKWKQIKPSHRKQSSCHVWHVHVHLKVLQDSSIDNPII